MKKKKEKKKVKEEVKEKPQSKKRLLKVKTIRPIYNFSYENNAPIIKGAPLRIPCGWLGYISKDVYKMFGGDNGSFVILAKEK